MAASELRSLSFRLRSLYLLMHRSALATADLILSPSPSFLTKMADWQVKLEGLTGLTREQKDEAEVFILQRCSPVERNHFVRGSDDEASARILKLLQPGDP